jgi:hypothetical protein
VTGIGQGEGMMQYQIRYQQGGQHHTDEIEANSPQEAVVKFEQIRRYLPSRCPGRPRVTSVSPAWVPERNSSNPDESGPESV